MPEEAAPGARRHRLAGRVRSLVAVAIEVVYPSRCLLCHAGGAGTYPICPSCLAATPALGPTACLACGRPVAAAGEGGHRCAECLRRPPPFDAARSIFPYEGRVLEAIHTLKYGRRRAVAKRMGQLLAERYPFAGDPAPHLVVAVPLDPGRLRERGFNQAVLLAETFARARGIPLDPLALKRNRETAAQTGLGARERAENVRGAFTVRRPARVRGRTILLVDDVFTTGATVRECARALRTAGASRILVLTLARTL